MLNFVESVRFHPQDLECVIQTVKDDLSETPLDVASVSDAWERSDGAVPHAEQLWHLTRYADPSTVYGVPLTE